MKIPSEFPVEVRRGNSLVKIYRQTKASGTYFRVLYYAHGKRKEETFTDYAEARKRAGEINDSVSNGNLEGLAMSNEDCILYRRAKDALIGTGFSVDEAARAFVEARNLLGVTPLLDAVRDYVRRHPASIKSKTVETLHDELLTSKKADGASAIYLKDLALRLGKFKEAFNCDIDDLTTGLINEWLRNLKCGGRSRNNYRRAVGTLIRFAEKSNAVAKDEIRLDDIDRAKEASFDIEIFTATEMINLLNAARLNPENLKPGFNRRYAREQGLLPLLILGAFAGMRSREIQRQKWSDINLNTGFIRVTAAKGGTAEKRLIPISTNLRKWLQICPRTAATCCTYPRPEDALKRLAKRAEINWKHNALRHSYASYRVAETQNVPQVALELGNSPKMVNRHYREVVEPALAKAWFSIEPDQPINVVSLAKAA